MSAKILRLAAALWFAVAASLVSGDVYDDTVQRAEMQWNEGNKAEAVRLYGGVWELRKADVERQLLYAARSADVGNWRWSLNFYKVVEQQAADNPTLLYRVYMGYAQTYRMANQPERAQPYEDKARDLVQSGKVKDVPAKRGTAEGYFSEPAKPLESKSAPPAKAGATAPQTTSAEPLTTAARTAAKATRFLKKRIAVAEIEDTVRRPGMGNYGRQIHDMLVTELQATNRFIVVERQNLKDILTEQDLAASGRIAEGSGPKTGQLLGAQLNVKASITDFEEQSASGYGVGIGPVDWDRSQRTVRVGMDMRIYNMETGMVIASEAVSASKVQSGKGIGVSVDIFDFRRRDSQNSTLGFVTRDLIQKALQRILAASEKVSWTARVMKATENEVYVNAGSESGVNPGQRMRVVSVGETLTDPDTGEVLAAEEKPIGDIEITRVEPKYSVGRITSKKGEIKRLDRVVER